MDSLPSLLTFHREGTLSPFRFHNNLGVGFPVAEQKNEADWLMRTFELDGVTVTTGDEIDRPGGPGGPGSPLSPLSP